MILDQGLLGEEIRALFKDIKVLGRKELKIS